MPVFHKLHRLFPQLNYNRYLCSVIAEAPKRLRNATLRHDKKKMKEYDTYIFDLDGTLLNTLHDLAKSTNHAMRYAGLPEHSIDDVRRFVGNGVRKLIERAVPGGSSHPRFDEILTEFKRHYSLHSMDSTGPYPGIIDMITVLNSRGKHIAVVSNKFYDATRQLCRHFFGETISVAIGEREGINKKPAPDTVLEALKQLGVGSANAVYVGDSEVDIQTARNSEMPCISVLWGFRDRDFLTANGAESFIETPGELLCW